jgi:hypothetical protein
MYGLTKDQYLSLHESQEGKCAICKTEPTTQRGLHVDHEHSTGSVRGLLCHNCNVGIGNFLEKVELLEEAIAYLKKTR